MKRFGIVLIAVLGLIAASCASHEPCPAFSDAEPTTLDQNV